MSVLGTLSARSSLCTIRSSPGTQRTTIESGGLRRIGARDPESLVTAGEGGQECGVRPPIELPIPMSEPTDPLFHLGLLGDTHVTAPQILPSGLPTYYLRVHTAILWT
eukprot:scaffold25188_cov36-Tisochrysis_lutea.AAC.1